ncbi:Very-short-patch-repair endonuclease [Sphingomonas sp. NFR04]|uniref:endonuclease domain-containing protein n=1 Tax=Sphingomonas sp. NFR04 TaxID=1566283 RepID=UPI0008E301D6|nr:DUF559 domain-containing protein [Sphingomonas sp. NFR04]SFI95642.1 Very-short-patch-repair endonuclease [Sphingomonas sp. NFR04]
MLKGNGRSYRRAKRLRREMTLPEVLLWQQLRGRDGEKWRKQHPAGPYVLDFYCDAARLCVEVDGEIHARGTAPAADARRDAWLAVQGVATMRVRAAEVLNNLAGVAVWIGAVVAERRRDSRDG